MILVKLLLSIVFICNVYASADENCPDVGSLLPKKNESMVKDLVTALPNLLEITKFDLQGNQKFCDNPIGKATVTIYLSRTYLPLTKKDDRVKVVSDKNVPLHCPGSDKDIYLSKENMRDIKMQGSGRIKCSEDRYLLLSHQKGGRFKDSGSWWGRGASGGSAIPFRMIAVDTNKIKLGSVVYIPSMKGIEFTLENGTKIVHDGFFFAGDIGGRVKGLKIDIMLGDPSDEDKQNTLNKIAKAGEVQDDKLQICLVNDQKIIDKLRKMHKKAYRKGYKTSP